MGLRNCVNRKRITFANSFYYIGFRIPLFRMLFQHNHSLHFRGEQTRSTSIFNTGFFNTLYNSYQKGSITLSRSSLMYIGVSEIISNLKRNFSVQKLNITDKGEKNYPSWNSNALITFIKPCFVSQTYTIFFRKPGSLLSLFFLMCISPLSKFRCIIIQMFVPFKSMQSNQKVELYSEIPSEDWLYSINPPPSPARGILTIQPFFRLSIYT